ncbi:unnamed protein product [Cyprideis torosa]|uniref:Uncharacterized protein n=1 Tax=Cyprideis torosa TaxID=163714 RepID=A0A7R8W5Q3_9CRUS|nr:unnamed protein product [Cyprideis torosa]CAG0883156.1 unnamed protein product [Cyprideis torosa]
MGWSTLKEFVPAVEKTALVWQDYVVIGAVLIFFLLIGLFYRFSGERQTSTTEYFLGSRSASFLPVAFSLMASFMSSITLLGVSSEIYRYGTQFVVINISYIIATPIAAFLFLPVFFRLGKVSVYEYLRLRFSPAVRIVASLSFLIQMIFYMAVVLYAPALALQAVTRLSLEVSILAVGLCCTFYSAIGGMKAVLLTDVFQSLLMFASVLCVGIYALVEANGSFAEIWNVAEEKGRIEFNNISPDPREKYTVWNLIIGSIFIYLSLYAVNQTQVQRLISTGSLRSAQVALFVQWPILTFLSICTCFAGLSMLYLYRDCDPVAENRIKEFDQLLPLFILDAFRSVPGLSGLFIVGIFSGTLSTLSSGVNSITAIVMEDYLRHCCSHFSDAFAAMISTALSFLCGALLIGLAYTVQFFPGGVLQAAFAIFGIVGGPLLGLFCLGMFFRFTNSAGALSGVLVSLAINLWIGIAGSPMSPPTLPLSTDGCPLNSSLSMMTQVTTTAVQYPPEINLESGQDVLEFVYSLSHMWFALLGFIVCMVVGLLVSCCTCKWCNSGLVDERLLSPIISKTTLSSYGMDEELNGYSSRNLRGGKKERGPLLLSSFRDTPE